MSSDSSRPTSLWSPSQPTTRPSEATPSASSRSALLDDDDRVYDLVVRVGARRYGIPVTQVREVLRPVVVTRVPGAPPTVVGIVNVRGAVVTVLDLSALLTGERAVTPASIVLLEYGSRLIGLAVQAVRDVRTVPNMADAIDSECAADEDVVPLDAAALCARHLLSSEETGQ